MDKADLTKNLYEVTSCWNKKEIMKFTRNLMIEEERKKMTRNLMIQKRKKKITSLI